MSPSIQSIHIPSAMGSLSIRGRGKKWKNLTIANIEQYAQSKGISFVSAFRELTADAIKEK